MAKYLFARYIWELTTIYRLKRVTLKELNEHWSKCYLYDGKDIPRRTFDYHRKEIEMLFNLNIVCDKRDNTYHVEDDSSFQNGELRRWLVNSVAVSSIVRQADDLENRIALEHIPSSEPFLPDIIQALRENKIITFNYQSFDREIITCHTLMPYALKLFRQRWYILTVSVPFPLSNRPSSIRRISILMIITTTHLELSLKRAFLVNTSSSKWQAVR